MRIGVGVLAVALLAAACSGGGWEDTLDDALERQPAELVVAPDEFLIADDVGDDCNADLVSWLMAVDIRTGERLWSRQIPFTSDAPVVVGDRVLVAGVVLDDLPPSVAAIDVRSGEPAWQRFFDQRYIYAADPIDGGMSVFGPDDEYDLAADGTLIETRERARDRSVRRGGDDEPAWTATFSGDRLLVDGPDRRSFETEPLGVHEDFTHVDLTEQVGDFLLVDIGADAGVNAHIVVTTLDGEVVWQHANLRHARLADGQVVYELRNTTPRGEGPTSELIARSLVEPGMPVLWQTQAFPSPQRLAGFVGRTAGGPVFAFVDATGRAELVVLADPDRIPRPLNPGFGDLWDWLVLVEDDVVAVGTDDGIALYSPKLGPWWEPTRLPVRFVARADDAVIAVTGSELVGCG